MEELDVIIKQFDSPDEIKVFDKGSYETVTINNMTNQCAFNEQS